MGRYKGKLNVCNDYLSRTKVLGYYRRWTALLLDHSSGEHSFSVVCPLYNLSWSLCTWTDGWEPSRERGTCEVTMHIITWVQRTSNYMTVWICQTLVFTYSCYALNRLICLQLFPHYSYEKCSLVFPKLFQHIRLWPSMQTDTYKHIQARICNGACIQPLGSSQVVVHAKCVFLPHTVQ